MRKRNPSGMRKKSTWDALSRWEHFQQQWRPLSWWIGVDNIGLLYSEHSVCYHVTQTHCVFDLCVAVLPVYNETIVLPIASPNVQTLHMSRPCPRLLHIFFHLEVKAELTWKSHLTDNRGEAEELSEVDSRKCLWMFFQRLRRYSEISPLESVYLEVGGEQVVGRGGRTL